MILKSLKDRAYQRQLASEAVPDVFRRCFDQVKGLDLQQSIRDAGFVIVDTEATGLKPEKGDSLISIAGIGFINGRIDLSRSFYELIKPASKVPPESVLIHSLTPGRLKDLPQASEVLTRFFEFCGGDILVGHHAAFDARFISLTLKEHFGITLANRVIDTAVIAKSIDEMEDPVRFSMEEGKHIGLDALAKRFEIKMPDRHDAYGDAFATALIFQRLIDLLHRQGKKKMKELLKIGEVT
jgi:DNA polymerase-3 subunit epsilon